MLVYISHSLAGGYVYFIIPARPDRDDQHLDNFGVDTVDNADIAGADAAASGQFTGKRLACLARLAVADSGFNRPENGAGFIPPLPVLYSC